MAIGIDDLSEENFEKWACIRCELVYESSKELINHLLKSHSRVTKGGTKIKPTYRYWGESYKSTEKLVNNHGSCRILEKARCPKCGGWGGYKKSSQQAYKKGVLKCVHCGNKFERNKSAFMDGVYLDEWDVQDRYEKYVREGLKKLEISDSDVVEKAIEMIERLPSIAKSGKSPRTIASGAVYLTTLIENERKTQEKVADVFNTTPVTLRKRYENIVKELEGWEYIESNLDIDRDDFFKSLYINL